MTHKENIQEILKGCDNDSCYLEVEGEITLCIACKRGLSEYLKAVRVELVRWNLVWNNMELKGDENQFVYEKEKDCQEAIKLGEKE